MSISGLPEFLLERLDHIAGQCRADDCDCDVPGLPFEHGALCPARVLAECEAQRRIAEGMVPYGDIDDINAPEILGLLAEPYADHPEVQLG
jgi:hypothetical protein